MNVADLDVDDLVRRPIRQWGEDGIAELVLGLWSMGVAGLFAAAGAIPHDSPVSTPFTFAAILLFGLSSLIFTRGLKTLKERLIFPRTGYVCLPKPRRRYFVAVGMALLGLTIAWLAIVVEGVSDQASLLGGPLAAVGFAAVFIVSGVRWKMPHWLWLGGLSLCLSVVLYRIRAGEDGILWVLASVGAAMTVAGSLRLRTFLREHASPEDVGA